MTKVTIYGIAVLVLVLVAVHLLQKQQAELVKQKQLQAEQIKKQMAADVLRAHQLRLQIEEGQRATFGDWATSFMGISDAVMGVWFGVNPESSKVGERIFSELGI